MVVKLNLSDTKYKKIKRLKDKLLEHNKQLTMPKLIEHLLDIVIEALEKEEEL